MKVIKIYVVTELAVECFKIMTPPQIRMKYGNRYAIRISSKIGSGIVARAKNSTDAMLAALFELLK